MPDRVAVGEASRPQGGRGAIRVKPWMERFKDYESLREVFLLSDPERRFAIESVHQAGKGAIIWKFAGVDSVEEAERLRGAVFTAERAALPGPEEGVYFWEDFEGRDVVDEAGNLIGRVEDMFGTRGNDVLVLRSPEGEEILIPALREVFIGQEADRWVVRLPEVLDAEDKAGEENAN
ncbi:MAG: ribosome maturation factor RimM [bacterium]|nr:ribosome maturation factor RimM [bacterium]